MIHRKSIVQYTGKIIFTLLLLNCLTANAADVDYATTPVGNVEIALDELEYRLVPLDKEELQALADYWQEVLQNHLTHISEVQILAARAEGTEKENYLQELNRLHEQQVLLVDRLKLILAELQSKGGDIAPFDTYIDATSGIKVDTEDSSAVLAATIGWLKSPEGGIRWAINIVLFFIVLLVFKVLAGIFARITEHAVARMQGASDLLKHFFVNTVSNLTKIIGIMIALTMLEINIAPLLAAVGAVGFIVGFALQGTLSNFASGLMILIYRPYDLGDVVNVAGTTGSVNAMTLVSTTLKLPDNQIVVIPNNAIWGTTITNVTGSETRRVDMVFGIGYDDDIDKTEQVLTKILQEHPLILKDPEPVIRVHELADSSVNFVVRPWASTGDYFAVYWDVTRAVKERFDAEGISIPYPQQDIHLYPEPAGAGAA